jgi:hypothetical protein
MFDNYTMSGLETLKSILTFTGTGASLLFGIIGTTFKTHKRFTVIQGNKEIEVSRPTFWLWIAMVGLIASSILSSSSLAIDGKISSIKAEIAAHPFYPFEVKAVVTVKPTFSEEEEIAIKNIKTYLWSNVSKLKAPADFELYSKDGCIAVCNGGNIPFDPLDTTKYDPAIMYLNKYIFTRLMPTLEFCIYPETVDTLNRSSAIYHFSAGNNIIDDNLIGQQYQSTNCKISYALGYDNKVKVVFSTPTGYWFTNSMLNSLYALKRDGLITVNLHNSTQQELTLDNMLLYCGGKSELVPIEFSEEDVIDTTNHNKKYLKRLKDVLKPEACVRH